MDIPDFEHNLPLEALASLDGPTTQRLIMLSIMSVKIDYLIRQMIQFNNSMVHVETEVIRSKKFREFLWGRITFVLTIGVVLGHLVAAFIGKVLIK